MKIIEIGTGYTSIPASSGAATEIVVEELAKVFDENNINYEIFDIKDEKRRKTDLKIREVNLPAFFRKKDTSLGIVHKLKRVIYSISLSFALKKEIKKSDEKIVLHFHNQYNMFFFLKLVPKKIKKKVKTCYTVHSYIWNGIWEEIEDTIKKRYFQEVYCVKNADKVFVLNDMTKKYFLEHLKIQEDKIIRINNGVNIETYKPRKSNSHDIVFFQSGSVCERKNQLESIKILTDLLKENKKFKYIYAGGIIDEEYQKKIIKYARENNIENQIQYVGEIQPGKELSKYYNEASAFIFPSIAEASSLVIIEALSSGVPVIMNKNSKVEILSDLKDVIFLYDDKESINEIIDKKILDETERNEVGILARKIIEEKYSWKVIAQNYIENFITFENA